MTLLRLSPLALSRSRFALSPLAETFAAMLALTRKQTEPWPADGYAHHAATFAGVARRGSVRPGRGHGVLLHHVPA